MLKNMPRYARPPVLLAYATFVLIGIAAGGNGVLLLAQMGSYGVDRATIGITFFTGSMGFVLAGFHNGSLVYRFRLPGGTGHRRRRVRASRAVPGHASPVPDVRAGAGGPGLRQRRPRVGAQRL